MQATEEGWGQVLFRWPLAACGAAWICVLIPAFYLELHLSWVWMPSIGEHAYPLVICGTSLGYG